MILLNKDGQVSTNKLGINSKRLATNLAQENHIFNGDLEKYESYFNKFFKKENYNVNYAYYILETLKRIDKIEKTKKSKIYADTFKTQQLSLL